MDSNKFKSASVIWLFQVHLISLERPCMPSAPISSEFQFLTFMTLYYRHLSQTSELVVLKVLCT